MTDDKHADIDPGRPRADKPFDAETGFSGQDYDRDREAALGRRRPSGLEDAVATGGDPARPGGRAHFDARTGEVSQVGLKEDE